MNLVPLLQAHRLHAAAGLSRNLGDGYLITHNFVYRRVREEAIEAGYRFSADPDTAYYAFPLLQLGRLLQDKVLPYTDNVSVFDKLRPEQLSAISTDDLEGNLKRNFIFHEGAHAVARDLSLKVLGPLPSAKKSEKEFLLRLLLEESCANTCEFLGVMSAEDKTHRAFYEINSYICHFEQRGFLKKAFQEMGPLTVIPFLVISYLHANFLRERIEDQDAKKVPLFLDKKDLTAENLKGLRSLGKTAFQLSERFRHQTTGLQLRLEGISTPLEKLTRFDFFEMLARNQKNAEFIFEFANRFRGPLEQKIC
ncbi:MAG TPA: hypothetical protein PL182_00410 [Pseudobdellovibrionaceae bacterium]|nr:hypothetical protein [Pseudobdellovibrionaceae bacterium]